MFKRFSSIYGAMLACSAPAAADTLTEVESERLSEDHPVPTFMVDTSWPRLPPDLMPGQMPGLAVDKDDNIWVLTRPNSLGFTDTGLDTGMSPACCRAAPHVLQFDQEGNLLRSWGGPELAPGESTMEGEGRDAVELGDEQWPANVHGLYVDDELNVWIGGNGNGDHVVLKFTADGEYLGQIGTRQNTDGNSSELYLGNPADIDASEDVVLVADGYINKRIIGFDESEDFAFEYLFGAYGGDPDAATREQPFDQSQASTNEDGGADTSSPTFGNIIHCVVRGPDDTIYVCDRRNNRLQLFRDAGEDVEFLQDIAIAPETGGTRTVTDVSFSPDGKYVYVGDMMNGRVWILLRETHEVLGWFGRNGRYPGQFIWLHSVAVDSKGNVYTTEVSNGQRVQRFVMTGMAE